MYALYAHMTYGLVPENKIVRAGTDFGYDKQRQKAGWWRKKTGSNLGIEHMVTPNPSSGDYYENRSVGCLAFF